MKKYYTRACNFFYGTTSKELVKKKLTLPLCGNKKISFNKLEIFTRENKKIVSKTISIKEINAQNKYLKKKIKSDIKKIILKRKLFNEAKIMGILNMTPDSFSDGGKYNESNKALKRIANMIKEGAEIMDIGGEATRPGSKTVSTKMEWKRIKDIIKSFKKKHRKVCLSIDTRKSEIMIKGIKCGAHLINDVSGFNYDNLSLSMLKRYNTAKVLHHMKGTPNKCKRIRSIKMFY